MSGGASSAPRTIYLLKAAEVAVRVVADPLLRNLGLTMAQYTVLALVGSREGLSSAELARRLSVTPQSMNEVIMQLEGFGLVTRVEDAANRRIRRLAISSRGREVLAQCDTLVDAVERDLLDGCDASDVAHLRRILASIAARGRRAQDRG